MAGNLQIYNVPGLGTPLGQYSHVARLKVNELLFIAGMLSSNKHGETVGIGKFDAQCSQVFNNIQIALESAGAKWDNVVQFTTYLVDSQSIPEFMKFRLREFPRMFPSGLYPPNTLLIVDRLVKEEFMVEVHTVAAL
jgi:enamine deaminase RidA (YjgF/YER057c/UK114 family)